MQNKQLLAAFIATILSLAAIIPTTTIFAQDDQGEDEQNGNGGGGGADGDESPVQVTVEREGAETEDINVTPNVTVVVDFEQTQVTNESVTIGPTEPGLTPTEPPMGNETLPPQNATVTPPTEGNETGTGEELPAERFLRLVCAYSATYRPPA